MHDAEAMVQRLVYWIEMIEKVSQQGLPAAFCILLYECIEGLLIQT